jgi:hypothetical protein
MDKTQYQPKLPPPDQAMWQPGKKIEHYTEQMHAYAKAAMDASVAAAVALRNLDARLRACIAFGLSAAEAYDSHYQGETKAAIAAVAGQIDAAVSAERERLAARAAYEAMVK